MEKKIERDLEGPTEGRVTEAQWAWNKMSSLFIFQKKAAKFDFLKSNIKTPTLESQTNFKKIR